ncbi:hypothetical protein JOC75_002843 [Metabacillus crassostreae]|uniref:hypothetical protein n=1 Tax=Metabacillus crassostreae TaxID=929098 RepID=UPI00195BA5F4|nr:hypothetical protein [Metabacillus crassostreae]MBM7604839.1 hypothetical protein [Metabacillus crassostreae]
MKNTINKQIILSTGELVATLSLCGYDHLARQILNNFNLVNNEDEIMRFSDQTEMSLKQKGYWDENRGTRIASGLENLLTLLVQSNKKIRCVRKSNILFIHLLNKDYSLLQEISSDVHSFSFLKNTEGYTTSLSNHFQLGNPKGDAVSGLQPFEVTSDVFDELHNTETKLNDFYKNNSEMNETFHTFLKDFYENNQEFDNLSFITSNYVKDTMEFDQVAFFLPSKNHVWHIEYEQIVDQKILIIPVSERSYLNRIEGTIKEFFKK